MTPESNVENVVVLVIDALRADRVGAYGSNRGLTPAIDSLAAEGTVFDRAFACVNTTDPSITSMHTGKYPRSTVIHHGGLVTEEEKRRIEAADYLPEKLSDAGVRTVAAGRVMGRWHPRGFDEYSWSSVDATEMKVSKALKDLHPLIHRVVAGCYNTIADIIRNDNDEDTDNTVEDLVTAVGEGPSYAFGHLMDTHAWYDADSSLVDELLSKYNYPEGDLQAFFEEYDKSPIVEKLLKPYATKADYESGLARLCARYDAAVREADQKVANLVDKLKKEGKWSNTALIVLSDHGESLTEHGIYFDHHGLYDETIKIPLVAHFPGTDVDRIDDFVQIHDLTPTILDLFGVEKIEEADGRGLLGYIYDSYTTPEPREHIVVEEAHTQRRHGIRTEQYKFIEHIEDSTVGEFWGTDSLECGYCREQHGDAVELFDLSADPGETENVASEHPEVVADMRERLNKYEESLVVSDTAEEPVVYDDEEAVMERLADLGYR